ncbi:EEIG1/EHBP1 N-terminal domain-containing protein [Artemisia annua]|uniref:EEIG1/EHBP1 N-terminal domain-containing protein n=1 Tax=Artemisia annua TaxID=35608 RepID=A0A2U1N9N6_ARTAN|nr:EEIG1/EHBP1 N-terminal domain-containing protein [Artemisia annua]
MSKVTKWKPEKAKVKVVFRLQFHATHIPQKGWEKLFISFIPTETGKATAKTSKANVRNGMCKWADPVYETTRLLLDYTSKQYDDKLYRLVVGMGTSRSSILGEATINLADYADASQPAAISLPLTGSDHGTILHVSVQLLTAKTGFREFEQQRDKGLQSGNNVNKETEPNTARSSSSELEMLDDQMNKAKAQVQLREETNIHEECSDSHVTFDGSSNASESYNTHDVDSIKSKVSASQSPPTEKIREDVAFVFEENLRLRGSLDAAESSISELKMELSVLQSHANEIGSETQKFSQELASEIASGQELSKEVTFLKSECSKLKTDLQKLTEMKLSSQFMERNIEKSDQIKQVKWVNGVLLMEDQIRNLQEKVYAGSRELDISFLKSDFEVLFSTVQDLKKETVEPASMLSSGEIPSPPLEKLLGELDVAKAENEKLVKKMNQMESYYEGLVQELEENHKRILGEFQTLRNEHSACKAETESLSSVNNDLQKRATTSESALKRARLNYSIAVGQLQKDLDMLSFQVLSMFETNQTVIKESFIDTSQPPSKHLVSDDMKKSLSIQESIYKKVEEELGEMCSVNVHLDVYSATLKETLFEASSHIRRTNQKLQELGRELQLLNQSRDVLNAQNAYYLANCNDLQMRNEMLETDVGNLSKENFLLMEKITECEALLADYQVYKSKHDAVSAEKRELENLLQVQVFDNQKNTVSMKEEVEVLRSEICELTRSKETVQKENDNLKRKFTKSLHEMVAKMETPNGSLEKLRLQVDSVANKFKSCLESGETYVENGEVIVSYLSDLELELEKMLSEDKYFVEQVKGLEMMSEEAEKSKLIVSELKQENQDLKVIVENKHEELSKLVLELDRVKESLDVENDARNKLEGTVARLTSELESHSSELSHRESENSRAVQLVAQHEESLDTLHKERAAEDLKLIFVRTQYEGKIDELVKQLRELENKHINDATRYLQENENMVTTVESLKVKIRDTEVRLNELLATEARYMDENETLSTTLEYVRLELEASLKSKAELGVEVSKLKDMLAKSEVDLEQYSELQTKLDDTESRLNQCLENEARYKEENGKLSRDIESVKLELEALVAHNAEILESKNERDVEAGQLRDMLTKSESEAGKYIELQVKVHDTESKLNVSLEENEKLSKNLESVRLLLEASIAQISKINNAHAIEVGQLKDEIRKYIEFQTELQDTESRLKVCLENEARYIEENRNLASELESLKLKLEASVAHNAEVSNQHGVELDQLKDMLAKSESEVEQYRGLQTKLLDMETRLNDRTACEARYVEENEKLSTALESLRLELKASISQNSEILESKKEHDLEVGQLKDMLSKLEAKVGQYKELELKLDDTESRLNQCLENEARYTEENEKLSETLESLRFELKASVAHNAEILESKNEHVLEVDQLKDMLTKLEAKIGQYSKLEMKLHDTESRLNHCLENEAHYIEENRNLAAEIDSLRSKLEASISHNTSNPKVNNEHPLEVDDSLISREESEIVSVVLKAKLDEQNDAFITLQNKCSELKNKLAEQCLKTEEYKNLSTYLKELKENGEMAREKKDNNPEGPSESLRLAFMKEQYQAKIQDLKQQLSVTKKHNEEMLFKLQDALEEMESMKKSDNKPGYDRIQAELECALLSLECCKEEKEKLVGLLQECEDEKMKVSEELSLIREQIAQKEQNGYTGVNGSTQSSESEHSLAIQGVSDRAYGGDEDSLVNNDSSKQLTVVNDQFRAQHLRSCMEQLDEELERMKNDNSLLPLTNYDPSVQDLQRELAQLRQANEELGSIYPNFVDFPGNGNALERVLALEIELAEALRNKKKPGIQFQSSFLKQHSDDEAIFKSFRDINELIKDMLEIKGKYVNVESELKEMHDRYSQLSLQFAEVEGERQKLMMTLKNVRSSRNLLRRSSIAALEDHSPL